MATPKASAVQSKINEAVSDVISPTPYREGRLTQKIEQQTARVPSVGYLGLAVGSMALSAGLAFFVNRKEFANFVGLWAPSFLLIGIYNKLVKLEGSDALNKPSQSQI